MSRITRVTSLFKRSMTIYILCLLALAGSFLALYTRNGVSYGYYRSPLDIPLQLAANFGELRKDHFHMGLDIRTKGKEGLPVYAAAEGYISHIKVEQFGLGNALFIIHPNSCTTVYGHLSRFTDELEKYLHEQQYSRESWEQELDLSPGRFPVRKGQFIAYSGNTGASQAPHLHFEIRDTKTGRSKNPLLEGLSIPDDLPPSITGLYWYDRRYSTYLVRAQKIPIIRKNGQIYSVADIVRTSSPLVSLGITAVDKASNSPHLSGIFHAEVRFDDSLINAFSLRGLSGTDSRYINACIDYTKWIRSGIYVQHLAILPGNHLPDFASAGGDGIIRFTDTAVHTIRIQVSDVYDNNTGLTVRMQFDGGHASADGIRYASVEEAPPPPAAAGSACTRLLFPGKESNLSLQDVRVRFLPGAFYDKVRFVLSEQTGKGVNKVSPLIHLQDPTVPVHDPYQVQLRTTLPIGSPLRNRVVMRLISGDSQLVAKGCWLGNWMSGSFNLLGTIQLLIDTVAPTVDCYGWEEGQAFSANPAELVLQCRDDLGVVAGFRGELDGHWILFARKGDRFTYTFDEYCPPGRHKLIVTVKDEAGNETRKSLAFTKE
jgi:Peptidase family M23